jgi:putative glutamine amidotransferase
MLRLMADRPETAAPLIVVTVADPAGAQDPALALAKNHLYADAVKAQGGAPVFLTAATAPEDRDRLLGAMSGLVLTGGKDIDPSIYGQESAGTEATDPARDRMEQAAWRAAERRSVPVLGICRGHQAINVFSGGKLIQDVAGHIGAEYGRGPVRTHILEIDPRSRLAHAIAGASPDGLAGESEDDAALEIEVNSYHHQAIGRDDLAPGLRAVAWSDSPVGRLIEGLEGPDGRWVVGVQCHPERLDSTPEEFAGLWAAFLEAATGFEAAASGTTTA